MKLGLKSAILLIFAPLVVFSQSQIDYIPIEDVEELVGNVHLVVEADTFVPDFYLGRSEPSPGSMVRLIALPVGAIHDLNKYSYYWTLNGKPFSAKSEIGNNSLSLRTPLSNDMTVGVMVFSPDGKRFAETNQNIKLVSPSVSFYEDNPLRGLSKLSIVSPYLLVGEETTIKATPWFMNTDSISNQSTLEWTLDNKVVAGAENDPLSINLNGDFLTPGKYRVEFFLGNEINLSQQVSGDFEVMFQ